MHSIFLAHVDVIQDHGNQTISLKTAFHRQFLFHVGTTYVPTLCLMIISVMTLFIDRSRFDTTVMVSLTTMLVMFTLYQSTSQVIP